MILRLPKAARSGAPRAAGVAAARRSRENPEAHCAITARWSLFGRGGVGHRFRKEGRARYVSKTKKTPLKPPAYQPE